MAVALLISTDWLNKNEVKIVNKIWPLNTMAIKISENRFISDIDPDNLVGKSLQSARNHYNYWPPICTK